jgi:hypothetical protein
MAPRVPCPGCTLALKLQERKAEPRWVPITKVPVDVRSEALGLDLDGDAVFRLFAFYDGISVEHQLRLRRGAPTPIVRAYVWREALARTNVERRRIAIFADDVQLAETTADL